MLTTLALLAATALADPAPAALTPEELTRKDALLAAFDARFGPGAAPPAGRFDCMTVLVQQLKDDWHLFTAEERSRMTAVLAPWKHDLADPLPSRAAPPVPGDSCFGQYGTYQLEGEHFVVEWDDNSVAGYAEDFLEALEYSYQVEVEELGWNKPAGVDSWPILAYIQKADSYGGAYTSAESCGGTYIPYIVAYSGSFGWGTWYQDMAAHEFNHVIQMSTSWSHEFWWWEATATWIEDHVYPTHEAWSPYLAGYTDAPWVGMNAWSQQDQTIFYHMYGMAIMAFHLDDHFGGHDVVKSTWDYSETHGSGYDLWIPDFVEGIGLDWEEVLTTFMAANTVMDYTQGHLHPAVAITQRVSALPGEGASTSSQEPESLGQNFVRFEGDLGADGQSLQVTFDGEDGVDWTAVLVSAESGEVGAMKVLDLDDGGAGTGQVPFLGGDIYLVVTPTDDDAQGYRYDWTRAGSWGYTWTAEVVDGVVDTGDPGDPDDTGTPSEDDTGAGGPDGKLDLVGPPQCGCGAGAPASGLLGILAALGLARRRRQAG